MQLARLRSLAAGSLAALVLLAAGSAHADAEVLEVEVGKTVEVLVGYAQGLICDDLTILDAEVRAKTEQNNVFVVTGKKPGSTLCRVGTDPLRVRFMYDVHVVPAKAKPAPKPAPAPKR